MTISEIEDGEIAQDLQSRHQEADDKEAIGHEQQKLVAEAEGVGKGDTKVKKIKAKGLQIKFKRSEAKVAKNTALEEEVVTQGDTVEDNLEPDTTKSQAVQPSEPSKQVLVQEEEVAGQSSKTMDEE